MLQLEQQPSLGLLAIGLIGLGVLGLSVGDFAMVWQPVAPWFPARTALAYTAAALMLICGVGLFFRATSVWATRILFPYLIVWQLLKLPALFVAPKVEESTWALASSRFSWPAAGHSSRSSAMFAHLHGLHGRLKTKASASHATTLRSGLFLSDSLISSTARRPRRLSQHGCRSKPAGPTSPALVKWLQG